MSLTKIYKDSPEQLVEVLGSDILYRLSTAIEKSGEARMAVSGGSTPVALFEYLSHQQLDWQKVKVTLVDDRCVPADHEDSNAKLVADHLIQNAAKEVQFLPIYFGDSVLDDRDEAYEFEAESALKRNFPDYHVVILGMGGDAHTASIFPLAREKDAALDVNNSRSCLMTFPETAKYWRITQTKAQLLKTELLALHLVGEGKIALFESIAEARQDQYPISHFIHQTETPLSVYCANQ